MTIRALNNIIVRPAYPMEPKASNKKYVALTGGRAASVNSQNSSGLPDLLGLFSSPPAPETIAAETIVWGN